MSNIIFCIINFSDYRFLVGGWGGVGGWGVGADDVLLGELFPSSPLYETWTSVIILAGESLGTCTFSYYKLN